MLQRFWGALGVSCYALSSQAAETAHVPVAPAERTRGERVSAAADFINQRFGPGAIQFGVNRPHPGFFERG